MMRNGDRDPRVPAGARNQDARGRAGWEMGIWGGADGNLNLNGNGNVDEDEGEDRDARMEERSCDGHAGGERRGGAGRERRACR